MSASLPAAPGAERRTFQIGPLLAGFGIAAALSIGLAFGCPTPEMRMLGALAIGILMTACAMVWPFAALQVLIASSIILIVWVIVGSRAINAFDLLLPPILVGSIFGPARRRALHEDARLPGPGQEAIREATRRLSRAFLFFYGTAMFSLVVLGVRGHAGWALDSSLLLLRGVQGVSLFALAIWWLRTGRELRGTVRALQVGLAIMVALDLWFILTAGIARAGMAWIVNEPKWPMTSANEAAIALLVVAAILQARPAAWRGATHAVWIGIMLIMLVLTQSRSGLLAWGVYGLFGVRWRLRSAVVMLIFIAIAVPMIPEVYWGRVTRTFSLSGGSFEAYSSLIRIYGWQAALRMFFDHPIFGVGYLGFRFLSAGYNDLGLVINTVENYYLEVAVGTGLLGLAALGFVLHALWNLAKPVLAAATPGTFGHELARRHRPLMLALLVANLTADNFVGMLGLAQVALWCALLIRAGHLSAKPPLET
jgi:hypothetical protein